MHIPKHLKIKRSLWQVIVDKDAFDSKKYDGLCDLRAKKILIDSDLRGNELNIILVHEILHSVWPDGIVSPKTEEKIVEKMAKTLYQVMNDNKLKF